MCVVDFLLEFFCRLYYLTSIFFFFKQKTAYEMRISDWSSDVCSSDLRAADQNAQAHRLLGAEVLAHLADGERADDGADAGGAEQDAEGAGIAVQQITCHQYRQRGGGGAAQAEQRGADQHRANR